MLYLVLEVAIDEVGLANDRDCRGERQEQESKGEHLVDQTTWSPRQRMTPFEKAGRAVGSQNDIAFFWKPLSVVGRVVGFGRRLSGNSFEDPVDCNTTLPVLKHCCGSFSSWSSS